MRVILYTGKGGVGKTSVAAATSLRAAEMGYKTVVMSTDPAHSLGDCFDIELSNSPVSVAPNLWAQEIDVLSELDVHWKAVRTWLSALMQWQGADEVVAEELAVLPGMEELAALLYINHYHKEGFYDLLVVDCAPTGETLRLLSFPDMARWYMNRLFPLEKKVAAAVAPFARGMLRLPVPGVKVFDSIQQLYFQLEEMRTLLLDPSVSSVRLVLNPEKMVIKEAQRTLTYLSLYGYHTDLVICNRVLPEKAEGAFYRAWKDTQERYLKQIDESFSPIPIFYAPLMEQEVVGLDSLKKLAEHIYDGGTGFDSCAGDPTKMMYEGKIQELTKENGRHVLTVRLPFTSAEELSIVENKDELTVQVGRYRRNIILPKTLARLSVEDAKMEGDALQIIFSNS